MVIQSQLNFVKYKQDIYDTLAPVIGPIRTARFIRRLSEKYDKFGRSFIDYKLALNLLDDYKYVEHSGIKFYACVGEGGVGKTTLMKNVMYWLDSSFDMNRVCYTTKELVDNLNEFSSVNAMKAILLDEPDTELHSNSRIGKTIQRILSKARQQKLFLGICATDMKDIPPYYWRKVSGLFFIPFAGRGFYFRNRPKLWQYPLQRIRSEYLDKGYRVFFELADKGSSLFFNSIKETPFTLEEEATYLQRKEEDYISDLQFAKKMYAFAKAKQQITPFEKTIINMSKMGLKRDYISYIAGITQIKVDEIVKQNQQVLELEADINGDENVARRTGLNSRGASTFSTSL